jgi:hypothetical protein
MNDAVGDFPGFHRVGIVSHAKGEAVEVGAVEKLFDAGFIIKAVGKFLSRRRVEEVADVCEILRSQCLATGEAEAKQGRSGEKLFCDEFHDAKMMRPAPQVKRLAMPMF